MREAGELGWWPPNRMTGVSATLRDTVWSGHPARLHGFVDGSDAGDSEWSWSRAGPLPATVHDDGTRRWMRTTFELNDDDLFDFDAEAPGTNVLLELTHATVSVHRLELWQPNEPR